jgi:hypothetical protein
MDPTKMMSTFRGFETKKTSKNHKQITTNFLFLVIDRATTNTQTHTQSSFYTARLWKLPFIPSPVARPLGEQENFCSLTKVPKVFSLKGSLSLCQTCLSLFVAWDRGLKFSYLPKARSPNSAVEPNFVEQNQSRAWAHPLKRFTGECCRCEVGGWAQSE